jgi:hypothetical protein
VSDSLTGIRPDQVTDIAVRTVGQPSSARHLRDLSTPGASSVEISYAIGFIMEELGYTDPDAAFSTIKSQLQSSVEDSTFNQLLQKFGFPADVAASGPKFGSETVVLIRSAEPSIGPTSNPSSNPSSEAIVLSSSRKSEFNMLPIYIAAAAVGFCLLVVLAGLFFLRCVDYTKWTAKYKSVEGTEPEAIHGESRTDGSAAEIVDWLPPDPATAAEDPLVASDAKKRTVVDVEDQEHGEIDCAANAMRATTDDPTELLIDAAGEGKRNNLSQRSAFSSFLKALSDGYAVQSSPEAVPADDHLPPSSTADTPQPGPEEVDALSFDQVEVLVASDSKDREVEGQGGDVSAEQQSLLEMVSELLLPSPPSPTPSTDEQHPGRSETEPSDEPIHTPAPSPAGKTHLRGIISSIGRRLSGVFKKTPAPTALPEDAVTSVEQLTAGTEEKESKKDEGKGEGERAGMEEGEDSDGERKTSEVEVAMGSWRGSEEGVLDLTIAVGSDAAEESGGVMVE